MKIKSDSVFQVDGERVECVLVCSETGANLENVVSVDTETGMYEAYVVGEDGNFVCDQFGAPVKKQGLALQFYFTITAGPRKDLVENIPVRSQVGEDLSH